MTHFRPRSVSIVRLAVAAALAAGCGAAPDVGLATAGVGATCPSGNGLFILYYGADPAQLATIRAARPSLLVLGDAQASRDPALPAYFHHDDDGEATGIRVLSYVPMNYGYVSGDQWVSQGSSHCGWNHALAHTCSNSPMSWNCAAIDIRTRIENVLAAGYDGVFFDETPNGSTDGVDMNDYVQDCGSYVKRVGGADKLVILNPGSASLDPRLFGAGDIVSVENDYDRDLHGLQVAPWRLLAVQGDPTSAAAQSLADAEARLRAFRGHGGFWYYSSRPASSIEPWLPDFADWVKTQAPPSCGGGGGTAQLTVRSFDLDDGGAALAGLWTVVAQNGATVQTGYTPLTVSLPLGDYSVSVADWQNDRFDHWADGATARPRALHLAGDATLDAYYITRAHVTINAAALDGSPIDGLFDEVLQGGTRVASGFSPADYTLAPGRYTVDSQDYGAWTFDHWDDGSTARRRDVDAQGTVVLTAYYR